MKRLVITILIVQLIMFVYVMGQLELIKGSFQKQINNQQAQINDIRDAVKLEANYMIEKK